MELRHLRYFVAIAEEGSFTRAAERLWIAQPGLSTQIRRLEAELGVRLFERHTRGVDLTPAGELLLERARVTLAAAEDAGATGSDLNAGINGTLRLGLSSGPAWGATAAVLRRFTEERPGVELTLITAHGGTVWRDLRDRRLDAVIAPASFASGDVRSLDLGEEPWQVLVGASHRLAGVGPLAAGELAGEQIVVTRHRDGAPYDRAVAELLADLGVCAPLVRAAPGPGLDSAVASGDAIALSTAPTSLASGVVARPLLPERTVRFAAMWRDEAPCAALEAFVAICRDAAAPPLPARHLAAVA